MNNDIGDEGAEAIGELLKENKGIVEMVRSLVRSSIVLCVCSRAREVAVTGCCLGSDPPLLVEGGAKPQNTEVVVVALLSLFSLAAACTRVACTGQHLDGNGITCKGMAHIAEGLKVNRHLKTLELDYNTIGDVCGSGSPHSLTLD